MPKFIMPMKCPKCGKEISQPILACPFCGNTYHTKDRVKAMIMSFFKKPPKNELGDSAEIRKWKRIRLISSWIGPPIVGIILIIYSRVFVYQELSRLKNAKSMKDFDLIAKHLYIVCRFTQIGFIVVIVAITIFMVASSKINKVRIIQKQKLQKK